MAPSLRLSKPPLITPSASPHPPRLSSRVSDHPSPSKKQRTTQTPVPDVQKERDASTLRLLDVWASLAERYSCHMDDDDLVDIRTGEIIKDNGVWRNAPTLRFGTLAAPVDEGNEVEEEEDEESDEYDLDELDAFAETAIDADEEEKSELDSGVVFVAPAASLEQANADDLREFLKAEKIRKEQCGTDVESDEQQSLGEDSEGLSDEVVELELERVAERKDGRSYDKLQRLEFPPRDDEYKDGLKLNEGQGSCSEPIVITSEDELDFWKADSNAVRVVHEDRINLLDSDIENLGSMPPPSCHNLTPKGRTLRPRQLHTPPLSHSSSKPSVSPLTTGRTSDFSGDDSSPSSRHRKRAHSKQTNPHVKPVSPQLQKSMARRSANIFRRDDSPHSVSETQISSVPFSKGSTAKPKQRAVVLLTPRKAIKELAKPADSHISSLNDPHDASPETPSRRFSRRKGKAKERGDIAVATPDNHPTGRKVKVLHTTELCGIDADIDVSAGESTQIRADFAEASPKRPGKHLQLHPLKRKRDSYSTADVSEVTMEGASPKQQIPSGSHSSIQNGSASSNYSPSTKWHSRKSRTDSDSDSEYDEPHSEQNQRNHRKRSASCVETRAPPPHFLHTYATPNHQNHFTPIPDPRAQLIIAQAVQQLSALVTGIWQPSAPHYLEGTCTPQRRSMSIQPSGSHHTPPTQPHMYPFLYDPAFSGASFPPESPELEHHTVTSRRSLVSRSHSRVRKVSFLLNDEESDTQEVYDAHRTPTSNRRSMIVSGQSKTNSKRGQTPGPSSKFHRENSI